MEVQSYHASCATNFGSQYRGLRPEPTNNERENKQKKIISQGNVPIDLRVGLKRCLELELDRGRGLRSPLCHKF